MVGALRSCCSRQGDMSQREDRARMRISAHLEHAGGEQEVSVTTGDRTQALRIRARAGGRGSAVNGGELLFLALATFYCNDGYREAASAGVEILRVEVDVEGEFGGPG